MKTFEMGDVTQVLVAKGDDKLPCVDAFQKATDTEVPEFRDGQDWATSEGRTFWSVKGKDVAPLLETQIARDGQTIGLAGADSLIESSDPFNSPVTFRTIGESMCRFMLMAPEERADEVQEQLQYRKNGRLLVAATSFPRLLNRSATEQDLPVVPSEPRLSGSVEAMTRFLGTPLGADLVVSGDSARDNGMRLLDILYVVYPAIAWVDESKELTPEPKPYLGIDRIDATFDERVRQALDETITSYTLELLRDPKVARDKSAAEFGEVFAAFENGDPNTCEGEMADVIYAMLVAGKSRGIDVSLGRVMDELILRNMRSTGGWQ